MRLSSCIFMNTCTCTMYMIARRSIKRVIINSQAVVNGVDDNRYFEIYPSTFLKIKSQNN